MPPKSQSIRFYLKQALCRKSKMLETPVFIGFCVFSLWQIAEIFRFAWHFAICLPPVK
jgi:hypothetical protein